MSILVTGGYGHLGSWVCWELANKGHEVIILDRAQRRLSYLEPFDGKLTWCDCDTLDHGSIYSLFAKHQGGIEGIVHIAGLMGGPYFASKPLQHLSINVTGSLHIMEAARIFKVPRMVYISSGALYGERNDVPDEDIPMAPSDLYGAAKASVELFGLQYANQFGLDFRAIRVYFAYGPGRMPSELYPLYGAVFGPLEGKTRIELPAGRDQHLDYTYVKDIARGIVMLLEAEGIEHRRFNICSGQIKPVPEIIQTVARAAGVDLDLDLGPGLIMPRSPSLDSSRLRKEVGWEPRYSLEQGLAEYAGWIQELRA
jgi:nucleoside-diphosphate-sugar epimerase